LIELDQPAAHVISPHDLNYSDADGDPLQSIAILSTPTQGTLEYYGWPVYSGTTLYAYELAYGYLVYQPNPYSSSAHQDSFTFSVRDG
jgi:hypothetical protein